MPQTRSETRNTPMEDSSYIATEKRPDTPRREISASLTEQLDAKASIIGPRRDAAKSRFPKILETDWPSFAKAFFPGVDPKKDVIPAVAQLRSNQTLSPTVGPGSNRLGSRWTNFPQKPSTLGPEESIAFAPLFGILNAIFEVGQPDANKRIVVAEGAGSITPSTIQRYEQIKPDGWVRRTDLADRPSQFPDADGQMRPRFWFCEMVVLFEFKKKNSQPKFLENVTQLLYGLELITKDDPRRRFVFGVTIEDTSLRVWRADRTKIVVSSPIDWWNDPEGLIHLALGLVGCSPEQLGFDLSCRLKPSRDANAQAEFTYICKTAGTFEKPGRQFQTAEAYSMWRAEAIVGSGTRIWKGMLEGHPTSAVLKDIWIQRGRTVEGEILETLQQREREPKSKPTSKRDPSESSKPKSGCVYLPTVLWHGIVFVDGIEDSTFRVQQRSVPLKCTNILPWGSGQESALRKFLKPPSNSPASVDPADQARPMPGDIPKRDDITHHINRDFLHYRIVYEEVGTPLRKLSSIPDVFRVLRDAIEALRYLRSAGYVHRDVSAGNLMSYGEGGNKRGILIDLEYAKRIDAKDSHVEPITGTMNFMACEVAARKYTFLPRQSPPKGKSRGHSQTAIKGDPALQKDTTAESPPNAKLIPLWKHNILHDLESLWWVALWAAFTFRTSDHEVSSNEIKAFDELFHGDAEAFKRALLLTVEDAFEDLRGQVGYNTDIFAELDGCLVAIRDAYRQAEKVRPEGGTEVNVKDSVVDPLFEAMRGCFEAIMEDEEYQNVEVNCRNPKKVEDEDDVE